MKKEIYLFGNVLKGDVYVKIKNSEELKQVKLIGEEIAGKEVFDGFEGERLDGDYPEVMNACAKMNLIYRTIGVVSNNAENFEIPFIKFVEVYEKIKKLDEQPLYMKGLKSDFTAERRLYMAMSFEEYIV